jgi:hypothetical protein
MTIVVPRYLRGPVDAPAGALGVSGSRSDFLTRYPTGSRSALAGVCLAGVFVFPRHGAPRWDAARAAFAPVRRAGRSAAHPAGVAGPFTHDPKADRLTMLDPAR